MNHTLDFAVRYDPDVDTSYDITKKIFNSLFIKRCKGNKPVNIGVFAASGEGKSWTTLKFQEILAELSGFDINEHFETINIFSPMQYPEKLDKILFDKKLKKVNVIAVHEARELIKSSKWQSFINQAIADINAQARAIKRLITIIISQDIKDITTEMRKSLNYVFKISRPIGKKSRLYIYKVWVDDRNYEDVKIKKYKIKGFLVDKNTGEYIKFMPDYFEVDRPSADLIERFEKLDYDAKGKVIKNKINKMIAEMKSEQGEETDKVSSIIDHYSGNIDELSKIGKKYRGKWKPDPKLMKMYSLTKKELNLVGERMNEVIASKFKMDNPNETQTQDTKV